MKMCFLSENGTWVESGRVDDDGISRKNDNVQTKAVKS